MRIRLRFRLFLPRKKSASIAFWYQNAARRESPDPNAAHRRRKGDSMNEEPYKICLRLNADEAQKLITNAKACGLTRTAYLRRLLNGYDLKPRPSAEMEALRTEIH